MKDKYAYVRYDLNPFQYFLLNLKSTIRYYWHFAFNRTNSLCPSIEECATSNKGKPPRDSRQGIAGCLIGSVVSESIPALEEQTLESRMRVFEQVLALYPPQKSRRRKGTSPARLLDELLLISALFYVAAEGLSFAHQSKQKHQERFQAYLQEVRGKLSCDKCTIDKLRLQAEIGRGAS